MSTALIAAWTSPRASAGDHGPGHVQARGAAGVTEVGRPLDVLRPHAEALARQRAMAELEKRAGLEVGQTDRQLTWQILYWTNGAVSVTATTPTPAPPEGAR
jgi:hypothetical protein